MARLIEEERRPAQTAVLAELRRDGPLAARQVAARLGMTRSQAGMVLHRLHARGEVDYEGGRYRVVGAASRGAAPAPPHVSITDFAASPRRVLARLESEGLVLLTYRGRVAAELHACRED